MPDEILLNEAAYAVWQMVKDRGPIELGEVVKQTGIDQAQVSAAATDAAERGYFKVDEREREELTVSDGARGLIDAGLPELLAMKKLAEVGHDVAMAYFATWAKESGIAVNDAIKWGAARGIIERKKDDKGAKISLTAAGRESISEDDADIRLLKKMQYRGSCFV